MRLLLVAADSPAAVDEETWSVERAVGLLHEGLESEVARVKMRLEAVVALVTPAVGALAGGSASSKRECFTIVDALAGGIVCGVVSGALAGESASSKRKCLTIVSGVVCGGIVGGIVGGVVGVVVGAVGFVGCAGAVARIVGCVVFIVVGAVIGAVVGGAAGVATGIAAGIAASVGAVAVLPGIVEFVIGGEDDDVRIRIRLGTADNFAAALEGRDYVPLPRMREWGTTA
jgi:hypothetical protein